MGCSDPVTTRRVKFIIVAFKAANNIRHVSCLRNDSGCEKARSRKSDISKADFTLFVFLLHAKMSLKRQLRGSWRHCGRSERTIGGFTPFVKRYRMHEVVYCALFVHSKLRKWFIYIKKNNTHISGAVCMPSSKNFKIKGIWSWNIQMFIIITILQRDCCTTITDTVVAWKITKSSVKNLTISLYFC